MAYNAPKNRFETEFTAADVKAIQQMHTPRERSTRLQDSQDYLDQYYQDLEDGTYAENMFGKRK